MHERLATSRVVTAGTPQRVTNQEWIHTKLTPGLLRNHTKPIKCCLVVDDFGVNYMR